MDGCNYCSNILPETWAPTGFDMRNPLPELIISSHHIFFRIELSFGAPIYHPPHPPTCVRTSESTMAEMAAARCCLRLATLPPYPPSANCVFRRKWRFSPDSRDLQNLRVSSSCATYASQLHTIGPNNATSQRACSSSDSDYADSSIREIRQAFQSMSDGEIRPSAYDTAWVARVPAIDGSPQPQFPQTLQWILRNQMADGSWGQCSSVYDRLLNALACSITLTLWGVGKICVHEGLEFIRKHVAESEKDISEAGDRYNGRLCGFGIVFGAMVNEARTLGLELPYELPLMKQSVEKRKAKLKQIPADNLHTNPTALLCYLEGLQDVVDWDKILNLQSKDGSFLTSPASTACVFMHTGDSKCLKFLSFVLTRFGDHVPCLHPMDLLEHLWAVDAVERLGIDRYFREEVKEALDYVYRYWNERYGIGWARENPVADLYNTAMGLRILRLHGYNVSADVLQNFKDQNGDFFVLNGESKIGIMDMLSLYRCSLVQFPGEKIMEEAEVFSRNHLRNALAEYQGNGADNKLNLLGEVEYALEYGWHTSVPRLEARSYIEQLGRHHQSVKAGTNHMWLGMSQFILQQFATNERYLKLAKIDFNKVHALYQTELHQIHEWCTESGFNNLRIARSRPVESLFLAAASVFEPELAASRIAWAKTCFLVAILDDIYDSCELDVEDLKIFTEAVDRWDPSLVTNLPDEMKICFHGLYTTVNELSNEASNAQGRDVFGCLHRAWVNMIASFNKIVDWWEDKYMPTFEEYVENGIYTFGLEPMLLHSTFLLGDRLSDDIVEQFDLRSKSLIHFMCLTGRLTNDARSTQAGRRDRGEFPWAIRAYMKDNPGVSDDEVLNNINGIVQRALNQLNWEVARPSAIPHRSKVLIFNSARAFQLIYLHGEGFTNRAKETSEIIAKLIFQPVK